jgi:hypothetical protein
MPDYEHYNETELGFREYIRRLEVELAAKNRQIRMLQESQSRLACPADGMDAEPERPGLTQRGLATLAVAGAAGAVMAVAVLFSHPGPAIREPMGLAAPQAPAGLRQTFHHRERPRWADADTTRLPVTAARVLRSSAPTRSPVTCITLLGIRMCG